MSDWVQRYFQKQQTEQDQKGGPGSGHHGHSGRPGERGGSAPGKGGGGSGATEARRQAATDRLRQETQEAMGRVQRGESNPPDFLPNLLREARDAGLTREEIKDIMNEGARAAYQTAPPPGMTTTHYDEGAERDVVLEVQGQSSNPKPGITREQMQRFYARRNAVQAASSTRYRRGNQTVSQAVDDAISQGMTHYSASNRWTTLTNPSDKSQALRFSGRIERDYIKVVLDKGEFKRNY